MYKATIMKMKPILAFVLFSAQCSLGSGHLRHSAGPPTISQAEDVIESIDEIVDGKLTSNSSNTETRSSRRLQHPCAGQGESIDGIEIE
jgi:hypothetical protein